MALLGALVAVTAGVLWFRFHYANDDLLQFRAARADGLSWPYLSLNVFQHFAPYNRLGHWVVYRFSDLSPLLGLALVLGNCAVLLAACLWLMTELRLSVGRRVVALVMIAFSVAVTESAIWFDAGMHIPPALAVTLAVCAAHVRGVRTGARRWHVLTVVLYVLGQLVQERPVLALPLLVLVDVFLLWRTLPWGDRLRRLWRLRGPLAALAVAGAGIAWALRSFVVVDTFQTPSWSLTARHALSALTGYVVPSLVNQPRAEPFGTTAQLQALAVIVAAGCLLAALCRDNRGPVLFAAAVFVLYYGFLKLSPLLNERTLDLNAERLNYAVYVTVPAVIGLVQVRLPAPVRRLTHRLLGNRRWLRGGLRVLACGGLAAYLVITNVHYLDTRWANTTEARAYLDTVRGDAPAWSDPGVTLLPLTGHPAMARGWSRPLARHERLLPLIDKGFGPADVRSRFVLIDDHGVARPATIDPVRSQLEVIGGGCAAPGRFVQDADLVSIPVRGEPLFLLLRYQAPEEFGLRVSIGWNRGWAPGTSTVMMPAGTHTRVLPVEDVRVALLDLQAVTGTPGFCVDTADLVRPLLLEDGGRTCRPVDRFGSPRGTASCP